MTPLQRIGVWLACLLVSATVFSLPFGEGALVVLRVTLLAALPVWLLYLPFVIAFKDANHYRIWVILLSGLLIGPAYLAVSASIQQLRGGDPHMVWQGNGLDWGVLPLMGPAAIVGLLAAGIYGITLKLIRRRSGLTDAI